MFPHDLAAWHFIGVALRWPFPPYVCVCFHQEMKFLPNVRGKKTDAFQRARSSDHSKITEEGKIRQILLFDSGQEQVIRNGDVACLGDRALQESLKYISYSYINIKLMQWIIHILFLAPFYLPPLRVITGTKNQNCIKKYDSYLLTWKLSRIFSSVYFDHDLLSHSLFKDSFAYTSSAFINLMG